MRVQELKFLKKKARHLNSVTCSKCPFQIFQILNNALEIPFQIQSFIVQTRTLQSDFELWMGLWGTKTTKYFNCLHC